MLHRMLIIRVKCLFPFCLYLASIIVVHHFLKLSCCLWTPSYYIGPFFQMFLALLQFNKTCSIMSASSPQLEHLGSSCLICLWIGSLTMSALFTHFQKNNLILCLAFIFQRCLHICLLSSIYPNQTLISNWSFLLDFFLQHCPLYLDLTMYIPFGCVSSSGYLLCLIGTMRCSKFSQHLPYQNTWKSKFYSNIDCLSNPPPSEVYILVVLVLLGFHYGWLVAIYHPKFLHSSHCLFSSLILFSLDLLLPSVLSKSSTF